MNAAQLINQTSGIVEYYTPLPIIEAARRTLGFIDLDPASSAIANARVKAGAFYTEAHDGLTVDWFGNVWMNHPFGRIQNPKWISKIELEFQSERASRRRAALRSLALPRSGFNHCCEGRSASFLHAPITNCQTAAPCEASPKAAW